MNEVLNKVAESGIITIDLANYQPADEIAGFDLKDFLFMGLILKEKDFRESLKNLEWDRFKGKAVAVFCSAEAIIQHWAYMLVAGYLKDNAAYIYAGTTEELKKELFIKNIHSIPLDEYAGKKVVIKGCGDESIPAYAYLEITSHLRPVVKSLMYGEPCSTVPVFKSR